MEIQPPNNQIPHGSIPIARQQYTQQVLYPYEQQQLPMFQPAYSDTMMPARDGYGMPLPPHQLLYMALDSQFKRHKVRKKTLVACETCRLKKIKCSSEKPACLSCVKHDVKCIYRDDINNKELSEAPSKTPKEDSSSVNSKLDLILSELTLLKNQQLQQALYFTPKDSDPPESATPNQPPRLIYGKWYTAVEFILQWPSFKREHRSPPIIQLLHDPKCSPTAFEVDYTDFTDPKKAERYEKKLIHNLRYFVNSYVNNVHTKAPVIDLGKLYMTVSYICKQKSFNCVTNDDLNQYYPCSVPILAAALGMLAIPLDLQPGKSKPEFANSLEQLLHLEGHKKFYKTFSFACFKELESLEQFNTHQHSYQLLECISHFLKKTCYMYLLKPLEAWKHLQYAGSSLLLFLRSLNFVDLEDNKESVSETPDLPNIDVDDRKLIERLYWSLYKEESEMRVELAPYITLMPSEILNFPPLSSFPIPVLFDPNKLRHTMTSSSDESSSNNDDIERDLIDTNDCAIVREQNDSIWYCFLNEIAMRKLENKFLEDLYSENPIKSWDKKMTPDNSGLNQMLYKIADYIGEMDVIVDKLHPSLKELMHRSEEEVLKKIELQNTRGPTDEKYSPRSNENNKKIPVFQISEALVFTKTRMVTMKMLLSRPIFYYISLLETKEEVLAFVTNPVIVQFLKESFRFANIANSDLLRHRHNGTWYVLRNLYVGILYILVFMSKWVKFPEIGELVSKVLAQMDESQPDYSLPSLETMSIFLKEMVGILEYWTEEAPEFRHSVKVIKEFAEQIGINIL